MNIDVLRHLKPKPKPKMIGDDKEERLWRASSLHRCLREQLLAAAAFQLPKDAALKRKFAIRSAAHNTVCTWLRENFPVTQPEYFVCDDDLRCGGHIDCVVIESDAYYVIEVKTYGFIKQATNPYWKHQLSFYAHTYAEMFPDKPVFPIALIVDLEGKIRPDNCPVTEEYIDILNQLNMYWDSNVLPPMADNCKDCSIKHICTEPFSTISELKEGVLKELSHAEGPEQIP